MSGLADRIVRLAARTLPRTIRDRYREEWLADVADARSVGMRPSSVAAGALVFAVTLDRDAPEIAGIPLPAIAQRRARWALVFAAAAIFVLQFRTTIPFATPWLPIVLALAAVSVTQLWAAVRYSVALGRAAAAVGAVGLAVAVIHSAIPLPIPGSRYLPFLSAALLFSAIALGVGAWGGARRLWVALMLAVAVIIPTTSFIGAVPWWAVLEAAVLLLAVATLVRNGAAASPKRPTQRALLIGASVLTAVVAFGLLDLLAFTPLHRAPGWDLSEIYSGLPPHVVQIGIGDALVWASLALAAVAILLVLGLVAVRRDRTPDVRSVVLVAIALLAVIAIFQYPAGAALWNGVSDAFGTAPWTASVAGKALGYLGLIARVAALIGLTAPRSIPTVMPRSPLPA